MGLSRRKGRIALGLDADLAIVELKREQTVHRESVISGAGYSIYEGWALRGSVAHTIVRGRFALKDGKLDEGAIGTGRYLKREPRAASVRPPDLRAR